MRTLAIAALAALLIGAEPPAQPAQDSRMLLTIFLRHDQAKTLEEIRSHLEKTGWIGQVVTVRLPPEKLRELNRMVEEKAWGAFRTEFYPTYDYRAAAEQDRAKRR